MNAKDAFLATLGQLQVQLNRPTYDTWLRHAELLGYEDGRFVVTVPNAYTKDWIDRHLLASMTQILSRIFRRPSEIQVIVWNPVDEESEPAALLDYAEEELDDRALEALDTLNPAYTFEQFIIGDANRYAALLAKAIIESTIGKYSPVLFHSSVGMGKTHLLQAITRELTTQGYTALYLTAENFTTQLFSAIRSQETLAFREKFRQADAVLIDDLQFVEGKDSAQNELIAIWDALRSRQKTIIFSSNRLPRDMLKVSGDARSRFQAGPIATIDPPEWELRCEILDAKSAQRGLTLSHEIRDLLAERITTSVRDLESAFEQLHTYAQLTQQTIARPIVSKILKTLGSPAVEEADSILLSAVIEATARYYRLAVDDLASRKRTKVIARARQLAMYLAREDTTATLPQIGVILGGRDHSTILHGCAKISAQLAADLALAADLKAIRQLLHKPRSDAPVEIPHERREVPIPVTRTPRS